MTSTLPRVLLTGAYLVILYFLSVPLVEGPSPAHELWSIVGIVFCLINIGSFWVAAPKSLRATLGGLNAVLGIAALLAVVGTFVLGKGFTFGTANVVPLVLYFLTFIPLVTAGHQLRLGRLGADHDP